MDLPYNPEVLVLDLYQKQKKSVYQRDICTPMDIAVLFTIAKKWNNLNVHQRNFCVPINCYYEEVKRQRCFIIQFLKETSELRSLYEITWGLNTHKNITTTLKTK
jgi:hypothetical protein